MVALTSSSVIPVDVLSSSSDEFFAQYNPTFRSLDQEEKEAFMDEKLSDPEIKSEWESYQENIGRLTEYFKNSGEYTLQTPEVAGETATYKNDLQNCSLSGCSTSLMTMPIFTGPSWTYRERGRVEGSTDATSERNECSVNH